MADRDRCRGYDRQGPMDHIVWGDWIRIDCIYDLCYITRQERPMYLQRISRCYAAFLRPIGMKVAFILR